MMKSLFRPAHRSIASFPDSRRLVAKPKALRVRTMLLLCFTGALVAFVWLGARLYQEYSPETPTSDVPLDAFKRKHKLRFDWQNLPLQSDLAKRMLAHQQNCSLPMANYPCRKNFGMGSDLHVWGQALCNAMEQRVRIRTLRPWAWLDETMCDLKQANRSAMLCYFPKSELLCKGDEDMVETEGLINITFRRRVSFHCESIIKFPQMIPELRAAGIELLFSSVSKLVINEAERQLSRVFPKGVPPDLITVQIRWGDKKKEMKLLPIDAYIEGVKKILEMKGSSTDKANVFLSTEDPMAVESFQQNCPPGWKVYVDQYFHEMLPHRVAEYNGNPKASKETNGHAGLIALGTFVVGGHVYLIFETVQLTLFQRFASGGDGGQFFRVDHSK